MPLADALDGVVQTYGEVVRPVIQVLIAADRDGAPLGPGLERLASDLRTDRRRRADIAARRLPIALLFPLVLCTLPAFGLLTIAPLLVTTLQALHH
jgi:pilus assembly protein TadC